MTVQNQKPNYCVIAEPNIDKTLFDIKSSTTPIPKGYPLRLTGFGNFEGLYPPFDVAQLYVDATKKLYYVSVNDLRFFIAPAADVFKQV